MSEPYDRKVAVFVPSRYGSGQPISRDDRDNQIRCVAGVLAREFGGATAEDIAHNAQRVMGTFQHKIDKTERFVDEAIVRVWAGAQAEEFKKPERREAVMAEACRLRDALGQECVMVEWDREIRFTPSEKQGSREIRFGEFPRSQQEEFALMAWHRVERAEDLCGVLSLAGWRYPTTSDERQGPTDNLARIAWTSSPRSRTAWQWLGQAPPLDSDFEPLSADDLLVMSAPDARLRIWLRTAQGYSGPREFPLATASRPTTRLSIEFAIAVLGGHARFTVGELLDAEGTTARFYREIRAQIDRVTAEAKKAGIAKPAAFAQRLIGRLLFLRFIEEKGWLPANGLRDAWETHGDDYYQSFLVPLFHELNTPLAERGTRNDAIPYLNGGLFSIARDEGTAHLPDSLFEPESKRSTVLDLLYRYHFTLDEAAARDQKVSVDPQMFGRVLESLSPGDERKKKGIHYTPEPVAKALAVGGVFSRLERRAKDCGLDGLNRTTLQRLCDGDGSALDAHAAERLLEELRDLSILDPAVGSGALLVACLEVLLGLETGCRKAIGEDLRKGSRAWAKSARHYITECLYGVDISPEAVEVARLRLWLFLAVGESSPAALPDLGFNLRVGNTLTLDRTEITLLKALEDRRGTTKPLQFSDVDRAIDAALQARRAFRVAQGGPPEQLRMAFESLEKAERVLREALGEKMREGEAPPFSWSIHFSEVFARPNHGFDLVIANPPYVRSATLTDDEKEDLKHIYQSWRRNNDLYFAFIERCLHGPVAPGSKTKSVRRAVGLAGKAGSIAFIMPNFSQTQSAEALRGLLATHGHIDGFVDFVDHQVFPTASNYVALLFATAEKSRRRTFSARIVTPAAFNKMKAGERWLDDLETRAIPYAEGGWSIRSGRSGSLGKETLLEQIAEVKVGIQTSCDDFYLCNLVEDGLDGGLMTVRNAIEEMTIEREVLFPCAKGSKEIQGTSLIGRLYVLWPYDVTGKLLDEDALASRFPLAWSRFLEHRDLLMSREKGKFHGPCWWRFRRPQGIDAARTQKILVPSIMPHASAYHDRTGRVICTASGSGGGGGWLIRLKENSRTTYEDLAEYLASERFWGWLAENGSPWRGGWRGVDRKILRRCPIPFA